MSSLPCRYIINCYTKYNGDRNIGKYGEVYRVGRYIIIHIHINLIEKYCRCSRTCAV